MNTLRAGVLSLVVLSGAAPALAQTVPSHANLQYGDGGPRQVLDIYLPAGDAPKSSWP